MAIKTRNADQGLSARVGRWGGMEPACCLDVDIGRVLIKINDPTAALNEREGGTVAGPSRFFQFRAEGANQNSSSHGHPRLQTSPMEIDAVMFNSVGN